MSLRDELAKKHSNEINESLQKVSEATKMLENRLREPFTHQHRVKPSGR